ncbi:Tyrosine-protein kinase BAZ1B [Echinococcus granulosus]|uniref:Tyrosine-protein kinase BAZ1B n=1 Tax=Echinococcus granulosus TaxID=6210 RepID=W6UEA7_ECHGR|nr:Tyrosine-protein kinase BAZ1B [Echinococcus granulosus]EUB59408.1 Tyrosine-protein kinase BAZ1B [Echinococcus granulosus]
MPLLGNRLHVLNTVVKKPRKSSEFTPMFKFVVPDTKEICSSEDELRRKTTLYKSKIWTCRVTGRANLTYKEAIKSEHVSLNLLKKSISDHYRAAILQIVHKSKRIISLKLLGTSPLEPLTQACWAKVHERFAVGEPVLLKVDSNKPIRATILGIDEAIDKPVVIDLSKDETSSPNNSDKENNVNTKRSTVTQDNFSYSVQLVSDELVNVNNVPAKCIQRVHRAPSKDHIRMFIRAHAMRYGPSSSGPWVVDPVALRKYCPTLKMSNNLVDKDKLRMVSETYEMKFYEKITSEKYKGHDASGETAIKLSPKSLRVFKNLSALRNDSPRSPVEAVPLKPKETPDGKLSKKMKQAILSFEKSMGSPPSARKSKSDASLKSDVTLPPIAKRLIRSLKGSVEANALKVIVSRCVSLLTDAQIRALPDAAQKLVIDKKIAIENRKKMQNMTPEQQKAYLRDLRLQRRTLIDENAPYLETGVQIAPLPEPRAFPLPPNMTSLQFSRILSFTEFIACYQPLLTESALSPGEMLYPTRIKQLATDLCPSMTDNEKEEEFTTDVEEESALTSTDAGLPRASVQGLRCLSLDRVLRAVSEQHMSAAAYRCLARPMGSLLRLLFFSEQFSKQTELGIQLSKIPITPYTAPELLRLLLQCKLANDTCSTNDRAVARIYQIVPNSSGMRNLLPSRDALGAASLIKHLTSADLFALDTEHRILAIEVLIELMLDFDTMDEYMHMCNRRAIKAWQDRLALAKQKRTVVPPALSAAKSTVEKEPESDDLASIVKSRRVLAAKAAEERGIREAKERERRELEAKIDAEEKALAKAEYEHTIASTEAKLAFRVGALGTDRRDRRYWRFFCAPNRLFVESNWAPEEYHVGDSLIKEPSAVTSFPPSHTFPEGLGSYEIVHRFGYAARSQWYVFDRPDELDALANALVERGARESQLRKNLVQSGLLDSVKELITLSKVEESHNESDEGRSVSYMSPDEVVISTITAKERGDAESILANVLLKASSNVYETEIHLRDGGLGGVPDFSAWMTNIIAIQAKYGLCLSLTGSVPSTPAKGNPGAVFPPSTTPTTSFASKTPLRSVAEALIAVGQHVHRRFLSVPKLRLQQTSRRRGENGVDGVIYENGEQAPEEDDRKAIGEEEGGQGQRSETIESEKNRAHDGDVELWMDAWVKAVRSAATLSRLNVLHACLDACILWEKSVANIRCRICRRNKDDDSLLLCDGCNSGFHLYCLRPPLHSIPSGDWFCVSCKPPSCSGTTSQQRRDRREASEASDSDEARSSASDSGDESSSSGREEEDVCLRRGQQRSPRTSSLNPVSNDTICLVCDDGGTEEDELVGCSTCPNAFHPNCHNPPLRSANRRAPWVCSVCRISRSVSGGLSAMGQSLRLRASSRVNRKSSYLRLHRVQTTPKKRPRPISDDDDSSDEESDDDSRKEDEEEVEEEERANDTETTEEQADERAVFAPPAKRLRIAPQFTCADLITAVRRHRSSWPFQEPVDPKEVPDYYEIVVDPIDLSMINSWLENGRYEGAEGPRFLSEDLAKMFFNAELYNSADSDIWKAGSHLENYVQSLFKKFAPRLGGISLLAVQLSQHDGT